MSDQELHEGKPAQTGAAVDRLPEPEVWPCAVAEEHFVLEMRFSVAILPLIFQVELVRGCLGGFRLIMRNRIS